MVDDVKLLKDQGINTYCICKKLKNNEYIEDHFEFIAWLGSNTVNIKAFPLGKHNYTLYLLNNKVGRNVNINNFASEIKKITKRICKKYTIGNGISDPGAFYLNVKKGDVPGSKRSRRGVHI